MIGIIICHYFSTVIVIYYNFLHLLSSFVIIICHHHFSLSSFVIIVIMFHYHHHFPLSPLFPLSFFYHYHLPSSSSSSSSRSFTSYLMRLNLSLRSYLIVLAIDSFFQNSFWFVVFLFICFILTGFIDQVIYSHLLYYPLQDRILRTDFVRLLNSREPDLDVLSSCRIGIFPTLDIGLITLFHYAWSTPFH